MTDYKLLRIFGYNLGSPSGYTDGQAAEARKAGAPQTALYFNRKGQRRGSRGRQGEWVDPKTGNVWSLFDEYMPSQPRERLDAGAQHLYKQTLSQVLAEIGFAEADRVYADVWAEVQLEIDVEHWMSEYDVDRPTALEQIRTDVHAAIVAAFTRPPWDDGRLSSDKIGIKLGMEA